MAAVRWLARKIWLVAIIVVIGLALLVQIGRVASPHIGRLQPEITGWLSDRLGAEVQVDSLALDWQALNIALRVGGLRAGKDGDLAMDAGLFHFDLLASLRARELTWREVEVRGLRVTLEQHESGQWWIQGIPFEPDSDAARKRREAREGKLPVGDPLRIFSVGPRVNIEHAEIGLVFNDDVSSSISIPEIRVENARGFHRLTARAYVGDSANDPYGDFFADPFGDPAKGDTARTESFRMLLEGRGEPRDPESFELAGYLELKDFAVEEDVVSALGKVLGVKPRYHWAGPKTAEGRLWLERGSDQGYSLRGELQMKGPDPAGSGIADNKETAGAQAETEDTEEVTSLLAPLRGFKSNVTGSWQPGSWRVVLQDMAVDWQGTELPPFSLQAASGDEGLTLSMDQLDLAGWTQVARELALLPEKHQQTIDTLAPSGKLRDLYFGLDSGEFSIRARLDKVNASAWKGAPSIKGADGFLTVNRRGGAVLLDSAGEFELGFPKLYEEPFRLSAISGAIGWQVDRDANQVLVYSGPLDLEGELGEIRGQFLADGPFVAESAPTDLTLSMSLKNSPLSNQRLLVPYTAPKNLRDWLAAALKGESVGTAERASFVYRGNNWPKPLRASKKLGLAPERQTVQLRIATKEARLKYHPDWPAVEDMAATILVDDADVQVQAPSAKIAGLQAGPLLVATAPAPGGTGSMLGVRASLKGDAGRGLEVIRKSPLRTQFGDAFDTWKLAGEISGDLTLSQPLGGADLTPRQNIKLNLDKAALEIPHLRLPFEKLAGKLVYETATGLSGSEFAGQLWGKPVSARIRQPGEGKQKGTLILLQGRTDGEVLKAWSGRPEFDWFQGEMVYTANLSLPSKDSGLGYNALFELETELEGVEVTLPAPFRKAANESRNLRLRLPMGAEGNLYDLRYGELAHARFWQAGQKLDRAAIHVGGAAQLPDEPAITIDGALPELAFAEWRQALSIYEAEPLPAGAVEDAAADKAADDAGTVLPIDLNIRTASLQLGALEIPRIALSGRGHEGLWAILFKSEMATGNLTYTAAAETPLDLKLDHLNLPEFNTALSADAEGEADENKSQQIADALLNDATPEVVQEEAQESDQEAAQDETRAGIQESVAVAVEEPAVETASAATPGPWSQLDFADLVAVDFRINKLRLGERELGFWTGELRPEAERLLINNISGMITGVEITGFAPAEENRGAQLVWSREAGKEQTTFVGQLRAANFADVLRAWDQPGLLESESARFNTALSWAGAPIEMRSETLEGELAVNIQSGRFLRSTGNASSALLRLLALFNFDSWARRLRLDFSDLVQSGMAFDSVRGEMHFRGGDEILLAVPLQVKGPSSELQMAGTLDMVREQLDLTLVATLPVGSNLALVAAVAGGLPAAAGVYLISKVFKKQVDKVASVSYRIDGDWDDPTIRFDKLFDDEGARREAARQGPREPDSLPEAPRQSEADGRVESDESDKSEREPPKS
ncbi:YhdP family phospholipid transporter [Biformimicrobium ophioploci]|uniref:YhdP central domain-containing protein n=1 Tax=Biformimicrobium ophioploci TaxID=3036711 RepID=A0ABQ6LWV4_9GAMM|nr:AsmA-like C-terminal region-containing protein [Microbulbifer sp. NKW57]GMG86591.1 hypothetical protein MNKW57_09120 [Microbulbifer sp. NKW57]